MKVLPMKNRYIVFSVPVRRKISGSSLYTGHATRYSFNRAEEIWIVACGPEVKETFAPATHGWLNDSFELEPTNLALWDDFKNDPAFQKLREFVDNIDGDVQTSLIAEQSLLAIDDDYEISEINHHFVRQGW
jgi:hypothetical protein